MNTVAPRGARHVELEEVLSLWEPADLVAHVGQPRVERVEKLVQPPVGLPHTTFPLPAYSHKGQKRLHGSPPLSGIRWSPRASASTTAASRRMLDSPLGKEHGSVRTRPEPDGCI
ncbi:hypothetical protein GCM10020219_036230 [Nonomuraea dietziae]